MRRLAAPVSPDRRSAPHELTSICRKRHRVSCVRSRLSCMAGAPTASPGFRHWNGARMSIARKLPVSGIFFVLAWLVAAGAAWADDSRRNLRMLLDGIDARSGQHRLEDTSDHVHVVKVDHLTAAGQIAIT